MLMRTFYLNSMLALIFASSCYAQQADPVETEICNEIARIQYMFMAARENIHGVNEFDAVEKQKESYELIQAKLNAINDAMRLIYTEKAGQEERIERLKKIRSELADTEKVLKTEILLPHQVEMLEQAEFKILLGGSNGNLIKVLEKYYKSEFELTDDQKKQLEDIHKKADQEFAEIKKEMEIKVKEIRAKANSQIKSVLTEKQRKSLERISGTKFDAASIDEESKGKQ